MAKKLQIKPLRITAQSLDSIPVQKSASDPLKQKRDQIIQDLTTRITEGRLPDVQLISDHEEDGIFIYTTAKDAKEKWPKEMDGVKITVKIGKAGPL